MQLFDVLAFFGQDRGGHNCRARQGKRYGSRESAFPKHRLYPSWLFFVCFHTALVGAMRKAYQSLAGDVNGAGEKQSAECKLSAIRGVCYLCGVFSVNNSMNNIQSNVKVLLNAFCVA
nr:hypothetical protein [Aeromonas salmonicida]